MRLNLKFPFLTAGTPKRNTKVRDVYLSLGMQVEVPEVSTSETQVAFTTSERFAIGPDANWNGGPGVHGGVKLLRKDGGVELRTFADQLYRRIGTTDEVCRDGGWSLCRAFPHTIGTPDLEYGADISMVTKGTSNAMTAALVRQFDWELERSSVTDSRVVTAWPTSRKGLTRHGAREDTDYRDVLAEIDGIDNDLSERSLNMIDLHTRRFLAIDGEIWMTCKPPCLVVQIEDMGDIAYGTLSLAHAHEGFDPVLSRRYFPIEDYDAARLYFEQCGRKPKRERGEHRLLEMLPRYEIADTGCTEYDAEGADLARIGYALASECARYQRRTLQWLPAELQDSLDAAMQAVATTNYVTGEFGDVTPYVEDLFAAWNSFDRPGAFCEVGPKWARKRYGDMLEKRMHALLDNAPVNLGGSPSFVLGGKQSN